MSERFGSLSKEQQYFRDKFKNQRFVIGLENAQLRSPMKKLLVDLGVAATQVSLTHNLEELHGLISAKPQWVFLEAWGDQINGIDIISRYQSMFTDDVEHKAVLISDNGSPYLAAKALERDITLVASQPFSVDAVQEQVRSVLKGQIKKGDWDRAISKIVKMYQAGDSETAIQSIEKLGNVKQDSRLNILRGRIAMDHQDYELGATSFEEALSMNEASYQALAGLIDCLVGLGKYEEAYPYFEAMFQQYAINPERIGDYVRSCIATEQFNNLIEFCNNVVKDDYVTENFRPQLSAALAISGRFMASKNKNTSAFSLFEKSWSISHNRGRVAEVVISTLVRMNEYDRAQTYLGKLEDNEWNDRLRVEQLKCDYYSTGQSDCLNLGLELIDKKVKDPAVFLICAHCLLKVGKSEQYIEDFVSDSRLPEEEQKRILLDVINKESVA